jgi:hypothetical protein
MGGQRLPGEPVREMLIEAVEKRFGHVDGIPEAHSLEFLSTMAAPTSQPRPGRSPGSWV